MTLTSRSFVLTFQGWASLIGRILIFWGSQGSFDWSNSDLLPPHSDILTMVRLYESVVELVLDQSLDVTW